MTITIWDVDGTILMNDLPQPDWDDPNGVHPTTGENIYGEMTEYNKHAYLNPQLRTTDLIAINHLLTGRPSTRRDLTLGALQTLGIPVRTIAFWPAQETYSRAKCLEWKAQALWWRQARYYVDDDPAYRADLTALLEKHHIPCRCISVAEWQRMKNAGVI